MPEVIEVEAARSYTNNNGKPTANREWIVVDADTEGEVYALFGGALPAPYSAYPDTSLLPYDMVLRDFAISQIQGRANTWRVQGIYGRTESAAPNNPFTQDKEPGEVGYRTANASTRVSFVDGWRLNVSVQAYQASGTGVAPTDPDMGGTPVDIRGNPTSYLLTEQEISITVVDRELPDPSDIKSCVGARNANLFLGYDIGSVLFTGFDGSIQPETGNTQSTFKFLWSADYHLRQSPQRLPDGLVVTTVTAGTYYGHAYPVHLVQPHLVLRDFNLLSPYFQGL